MKLLGTILSGAFFGLGFAWAVCDIGARSRPGFTFTPNMQDAAVFLLMALWIELTLLNRRKD